MYIRGKGKIGYLTSNKTRLAEEDHIYACVTRQRSRFWSFHQKHKNLLAELQIQFLIRYSLSFFGRAGIILMPYLVQILLFLSYTLELLIIRHVSQIFLTLIRLALEVRIFELPMAVSHLLQKKDRWKSQKILLINLSFMSQSLHAIFCRWENCLKILIVVWPSLNLYVNFRTNAREVD